MAWFALHGLKVLKALWLMIVFKTSVTNHGCSSFFAKMIFLEVSAINSNLCWRFIYDLLMIKHYNTWNVDRQTATSLKRKPNQLIFNCFRHRQYSYKLFILNSCLILHDRWAPNSHAFIRKETSRIKSFTMEREVETRQLNYRKKNFKFETENKLCC